MEKHQPENQKQTNLINSLLLDTSVSKNLLDGLHGLSEQINVKLLELGSGKSLREIVSTLERLDLHLGGHLGRQRSLGLLDLPLELTHRPEVGRHVGSSLLLVLLGEVLDHSVVEILSSQVGISGGSEDLEHSVVDGKQRDIEGSSSQVVHDDLGLSTLLVESVSDGGGGGLVDDSKDGQSGDRSGVLGGLSLSVVEV